MIAYLCNFCEKPIDLENKKCVHFEIRLGERGIQSKGVYGDGWSADLCSKCGEKILPLIDKYYYGDNKYLMGDK